MSFDRASPPLAETHSTAPVTVISHARVSGCIGPIHRGCCESDLSHSSLAIATTQPNT